jgi:HEAT repeat protein
MNDAHEDFFVPIIRDGKVEKWPIQFEPEVDIWDTATGEKVAALPMEAETLAFSPDGLHLAAGGSDGTILIWAMPKIALLSKAEPPSSQQLDGWWRALGRDAEPAEEAIVQLAAAAEHSMKLFKERVKPVKTPDDKVVAKLIAQLDSEEYAERETAQTALRRLGDCAAHYFKKALEGEISLEAQRRLKELLDDCNDNSSVALQNHRAIAVIEWIGTPEAHKLLRTLADGDAQARLTIEARAALKRLGAGRCDK